MNRSTLHVIAIVAFSLSTAMAVAKDYIIYSMMQDFPTGEAEYQVKKNYYLNLGEQQGVKEGTVLNVFRNVSILDPYESKNRFNHQVKIGEIKVIHSENASSIGLIHKAVDDDAETPLLDVKAFMIGDKVDVKVK